MPYGLRIYTDIPRPDRALVERFAAYASADLSDVMRMAGTMDPGIRPAYRPIAKIVGPAITISVPTGAQNVRKMGFAAIQPGDVVVINGAGASHYAVLGGNLGLGIRNRGAIGVVIDGAFRDLSDFQEMGLPMYSRSTCTLPAPKDGPGEVNVPIACGGIVVNPGDIIVADGDGIVAVPPAYAEEILDEAARLTARFAVIRQDLVAGAIPSTGSLPTELSNAGWTIQEGSYARG